MTKTEISPNKYELLLFIAHFKMKLTTIEIVHKRWFANHSSTELSTHPDSMFNYIHLAINEDETLRFEFDNIHRLPKNIKKDFFEAVRSSFMKAI